LRVTVQNNQADIFSALIILAGAGTLLILFPVILIALPLINRRLRPPTGALQPPAPAQIDV
jgi:hypothetical protein